MTTRTATIDGIEMRWEEHGTGTPVCRIEAGKHSTPEDFPEIFAEEIMALAAAT